jgi:hypothetical protein
VGEVVIFGLSRDVSSRWYGPWGDAPTSEHVDQMAVAGQFLHAGRDQPVRNALCSTPDIHLVF